MHLSHLNALRALEASLRHGSFSAAAEELGVTAAAVGQRVRSLEDYLGRDLFRRTSAGVEPLDEAKQVKTLLTTGMSALSAAMDQLRLSASRTRLSVTLPASFAEHWLTPSISDFYQRHDEIDLRLHASNRDVDMLTEDFDFAIRYGRPTREPLEEIVLFGDFVLPVCSPGFLRRHDIDPQRRSLQGIPLIHLDNRTSDPGWVGFEGWAAAFGFDTSDLQKGVRYSRVNSGLKSALEGQGLVLSGLVEAFNAIRAGQLVMPFGSSMRCPTEYAYRLIWVRKAETTAVGRDFIDWVLGRADQHRRQVAQLLDGD